MGKKDEFDILFERCDMKAPINQKQILTVDTLDISEFSLSDRTQFPCAHCSGRRYLYFTIYIK